MSKESLEWLNTNVLIGNADVRGTAWHYEASLQGDQSNHYPGFIPVQDVQDRLFSWEALKVPVASQITRMDETGVTTEWVEIPGKCGVVRSDTGATLGVFSDAYEPHQYGEWLLKTVSSVLSDTLNITSAGILKGGAVGWVEIGVPSSVTTPEGVTFLPNLLAGTSFDGSIATFFKRTARVTVCDNTFEIARRSQGSTYRIKHTSQSGFKIDDARQALDLVHQGADDFAAEIEMFCQIPVTDKAWDLFLEEIAPTVDAKSKRGATQNTSKQDVYRQLWTNDDRVSPWAGTAWGVLQADNTYRHHEMTLRGSTTRADRNALNALTGQTAKGDDEALAALEKVLSLV